MTAIAATTICRIVGLFLFATLYAATIAESYYLPSPPSVTSVRGRRSSNISSIRRSSIQQPSGASPPSATALSERRWNFNEGQSPWGMKINAETWNGRVAQVRWNCILCYRMQAKKNADRSQWKNTLFVASCCMSLDGCDFRRQHVVSFFLARISFSWFRVSRDAPISLPQ
jgi:hypothetical protein